MPTLQGEALVKVPAETQTGKLFRLRGKGVKSVRSHAPATCCAGSWSKRRST